jgi:dihydroorotase/N-acyl-D-amino-acid deacylase
MDSIREALRIGREAGVPVHISHLKAASQANWGRTEDALAAIDGARAQGQDVSCDVYPYTAASTLLGSTLPAWVLVGGIDAMVARLRDRASRDRIRHDWQERPPLAGWDAIFIAGCAGRPELEGKGVAALAAARGADPVDLVLDLIAEQAGRVTMVIHLMHEDDVERVIAHPASMIGSDAIPAPGKPHPRLAGTFVRVLGHYVRERELLDLPTAVRKMTAMPAARFGLRDRGVLAPGKIADVVVFDPATVIDRATYEQPLLTPIGVRAVIVNGRVAVRDDAATGLRAGVMLGG